MLVPLTSGSSASHGAAHVSHTENEATGARMPSEDAAPTSKELSVEKESAAHGRSVAASTKSAVELDDSVLRTVSQTGAGNAGPSAVKVLFVAAGSSTGQRLGNLDEAGPEENDGDEDDMPSYQLGEQAAEHEPFVPLHANWQVQSFVAAQAVEGSRIAAKDNDGRVYFGQEAPPPGTEWLMTISSPGGDAMPGAMTAAPAGATDSAALAPLSPQVAGLIQHVFRAGLSELEAGLLGFLDTLEDGAEKIGSMPENTSLVPWLTAAVFSAAAMEMARRQLTRAAAELAPLAVTAARTTGYYHRPTSTT